MAIKNSYHCSQLNLNPMSTTPGITRPKPGKANANILNKLNFPDIEFTKIKAYQHRTKKWQDAGYSSHHAASGRVHLHKNRNVYIKGFPAWRIGFKNKYRFPVDIEMFFSVHDKYGLVETFNKSYNNLRPGEPAEIYVIQDKRKTRIKLEAVEVLTGHQPLYTAAINEFLLRNTWGWVKSVFIVLFMGIYTGIIASRHVDVPDIKGAAIFLSVFAFFIAFWELFNITPVMFMILFMVIVPFSLHDPGEIGFLMLLGSLYLWAVWKKRYSIKDFLIGAFTAKSM